MLDPHLSLSALDTQKQGETPRRKDKKKHNAACVHSDKKKRKKGLKICNSQYLFFSNQKNDVLMELSGFLATSRNNLP